MLIMSTDLTESRQPFDAAVISRVEDEHILLQPIINGEALDHTIADFRVLHAAIAGTIDSPESGQEVELHWDPNPNFKASELLEPFGFGYVKLTEPSEDRPEMIQHLFRAEPPSVTAGLRVARSPVLHTPAAYNYWVDNHLGANSFPTILAERPDSQLGGREHLIDVANNALSISERAQRSASTVGGLLVTGPNFWHRAQEAARNMLRDGDHTEVQRLSTAIGQVINFSVAHNRQIALTEPMRKSIRTVVEAAPDHPIDGMLLGDDLEDFNQTLRDPSAWSDSPEA